MIRRKKKSQEVVPPNPIKVLLEFTEADERYVNMMLRKSAMRTLTKYKKNPPPQTPAPAVNPELDSMLSAIEARMGLSIPISSQSRIVENATFPPLLGL